MCGIPSFAAKYSDDVDENDQIRYGIELDIHKGNCNGQIQGQKYFTTRNGFGLYVTPNQLKLLDENERQRPKKLNKRNINELMRSERKQYLITGYSRIYSKGLYIPNVVSNLIVQFYSSIINWILSENIKYIVSGDQDIAQIDTDFPPSTYLVSDIPWIKGI